MTTLELLTLEVARARRQYPAPMTVSNFVGVATFKLHSVIRHVSGHQLSYRQELKQEVAQLALQLAALSIRLIEDTLGGLSEEYYNRNNAVSDEIKKS